MDTAARAEFEAELRRSFDAGDLHAVATGAIRGYGPELFGFLVGLAREATAAEEIFAGACEKIWRALPAFRWDSTLRTWAYAITRHHFHHWVRHRDQQRRMVPLSDAPEVSAVVAAVRTVTATHLRTDVKDGLARLRDSLSPDDQILLGLRLDRRMAWRDIARVLGGEEAPPPQPREVAALRKRFERLKQDLVERARRENLVR